MTFTLISNLFKGALRPCQIMRGRSTFIRPCRFFGQPAPQTHPHLVSAGEVTPGITLEEYRERRNNLSQLILKNKSTPHEKHIAIIPSAAKLYMSHDIPYVFRQNTDFLYLSGFMEPMSVLVLEIEGGYHTSRLFVPKRDVSKELWEGARSGKEGAMKLTGVDTADNLDDLSEYLYNYSRDNNGFMVWYDYSKPSNIEIHIRHLTEFLKSKVLTSPRRLVQKLRAIKSPAEVELMKGSSRIASNAFIQVMKFSHPGVNEAHLHARMEYECRLQSAEYLAYPPVVAGGNRANTIHYIQNNQLVDEGDLVLMDAGCEYHGYSSDITRTWPVSGSFTGVQREVYEALLEVQEACIQMATPRVSIETIFHQMLHLLGLQLQRLNIIPGDINAEELERFSRSFCPHHVSHYLGMDVHDTDEISRTDLLQPGMVITIEPGIYIPHTKTGVAKELRGMGMRIEDDVLVTENGPQTLTKDCPKDPDHIEAILSTM